MKRIITSLTRRWRGVGAILALVALFTVGFGSPAMAVGFGDDPTAPVSWTEAIFGSTSLTLVDILQIGVIPLLPFLVGLVNRALNWPPLAKRLALAVLSLAAVMLPDLVQALNDGVTYDWIRALFLGVVAYVFAEGTYQKFYKASISKSGDPDKTLAAKVAGN